MIPERTGDEIMDGVKRCRIMLFYFVSSLLKGTASRTISESDAEMILSIYCTSISVMWSQGTKHIKLFHII